MNKVLMLAYYFPPLGMGGTQRPAKFARYLPESGWQPVVLSVKPIAYWAEDPSLLDELAGVEIVRTGSFDPQRLLRVVRGEPRRPEGGEAEAAGNGRAPAGAGGKVVAWINRRLLPWFLLPDSKILWSWHARRAAAALLRSGTFSAIWSTSPPHSTHLIARRLARRYRLPWIADFRDAWAESVVVHQPTAWHRRRQEALLRRVAGAADLLIGVTPGIVTELEAAGGAGKTRLMTNGFDAADFSVATPAPAAATPAGPTATPLPASPAGTQAPAAAAAAPRFTLCHCGSISRFSDPAPLLAALRPQDAGCLRLHFVGYDAGGSLTRQVRASGLESLITCSGYRPHHEAIAAMTAADALVLIACDEPGARFIPGKSFEYLASRKPILLISNVTETLRLLAVQPGVVACAPDQPQAIRAALERLQQDPELARAAAMRDLRPFDRRQQAALLAGMLQQLSEKPLPRR
ncbi:MAG TPA: glycosyltransferase [bacterium]|nr:glycosyltransferase [bacterium]